MLARLLLTLHHAWAMWRVLSRLKNREKGTWRESSQQRLLVLAYQEMSELHAAVWAHEQGRGTAVAVECEAADVSAYVAMISDNAKRNKKEKCQWAS